MKTYISGSHRDSEVSTSNTLSALQGRWKFVSLVQTTYGPNGLPINSHAPSEDGDYFEFFTDGQLHMQIFGILMPTYYRLYDENKIVIGEVEQKINIVTDDILILSLQIISQGIITEKTFNLKKQNFNYF